MKKKRKELISILRFRPSFSFCARIFNALIHRDFSMIFVHDGINFVADYNSLRVGVGCMSVVCRMYVVRRKFHDWITFERLEILS